MPQTNVQQLDTAGLIANASSLTQAQEDAINDLTQDEIDCLITIADKLDGTGLDSPVPEFF